MPKAKPWQGIVKVQQPIVSNDPTPHVLIYNEDRSIFEQMEVQQKFLRHLMGDDLKRYFQAHTDGEKLVIDHQVSEQPW